MKKIAIPLLIVFLLLAVSPALFADPVEIPGRSSKFFLVDMQARKVLGPAPHVSRAIALNLVSVSVDQPSYWPNETVRLKVIMPGRPGSRFTATLQKRDANRTEIKGSLDPEGVAVVTLMDGGQKKLQLGEYRVDLRTEDGKGVGSATFTVVEGSLGAVSLAHEFKQVTSAAALETAGGAWFLGNAGGSGKRWGNGLSFKNELRVANQPYNGEVKVITRCMLPGCNGVQAGPTQTIRAVGGKIEATMQISSHSGPFQIELITSGGSLRHQFEGSSHVERDMLQVSGGVSWEHRAGLAPYEKTEQVPGRQLFVEKKKVADDPFEISAIIAKNGEITVRIAHDVQSPALIVWSPKSDGGFEPKPMALPERLKAGRELKVTVAMPYSVITVGGFMGGVFKEGWAMALLPTQLKLGLEVPKEGAPGQLVRIGVTATDESGAGRAVSGILEVYDNRVASRSPMSGLASALGDSLRAFSRSAFYWQDRTGIDEQAEHVKQDMSDRKTSAAVRNGVKLKKSAPRPAAAAGRASAVGGDAGRQHDDDETQELIREGERKVVFCGLVTTGADGKAQVDMTLPPQTGRLAVRFVAVRGLDHAAVSTSMDLRKKAGAEAVVPSLFVAGAQLQVPVHIANALREKVFLTARGVGIDGSVGREFGPGAHEITIPWRPRGSGSLLLELTDAKGRVLDKREHTTRSLSSQPVTYSRLVVAGQEPIPLQADETAVVYPGPGALLNGIVTNMVTTMESWFGHAEALSAQAAFRAVILSAVARQLIQDEGFSTALKVDLDKALRDLDEAFLDKDTSLVRPYPGLAQNPLWSARVSANLHTVARVLKTDPALNVSMASAINRAAGMAARIDAALKLKGFVLEEQGYDADGNKVIPVEIDGKVAYRVLTDDAVSRWVAEKLLPTLDSTQENPDLSFARALDTFRFLRAFERVGSLQYLTDTATALWLKGDRARFEPLFAKIARGMILAQEPGMVQGPALLGGVYSSPRAMISFLELLVAMAGTQQQTGPVTVMTGNRSHKVATGIAIKGAHGMTLKAPAGMVARIDRAGSVSLTSAKEGKTMGSVTVTPPQLALTGEAVMTITLDATLDPLEYYALVAVPTTTTIKQTGDILSDYRGELIYGQQASGSSKQQVIAVPFRGSRTIRLLLEGGWQGTSPGAVLIRHIENPFDHGVISVPTVTVITSAPLTSGGKNAE